MGFLGFLEGFRVLKFLGVLRVYRFIGFLEGFRGLEGSQKTFRVLSVCWGWEGRVFIELTGFVGIFGFT